jgi:O-antigen/teichoic acid export membrane protein
MISLSKKDVYWSFFARFLDIAAGLIILPLILRILSAEEIGMNYLMLSIGSLVILFDFGFAPQFGRNISYVYSGAQELKKEGVQVVDLKSQVNFRLLATMIFTARYVYRRLSIIVLFVMLSLGSIYIYHVTKGFTNVSNSLIIWLIYSASTFFNIYYSYYTSLLTGRGLITASRKATVFSRLTYIILSSTFLFLGMGLLGVVLAEFIAPFVKRHISYISFFTRDLKQTISRFDILNNEKIELFKIIWYNSRKMGIVFICTFFTTKFGLFLAGLYLPLSEIASFGLMIHLIGFIVGISSTLFEIYQPRFSSLRIKGDNKTLIKEFAFSMNIFYVLYIAGVLFLILFGQDILTAIGSNAFLPSFWILSIYAFVIFLEANHSNYATFITTSNNIPFVVPAVIGSLFIVLGSYISLEFTGMGILGLILIQGITESAYDNWKWPLVVHKEFNISLKSFLFTGFNESVNRVKIYSND